MTNYQKLLNHLEELKLHQIRHNLPTFLELVNTQQKTFVDTLYELTRLEIEAKRIRTIYPGVTTAGFPFLKTLEDFDFNYQPTIKKSYLYDLASLRFIENKENIIFIGTPGVGKTHLAVALGIGTATYRKIAYFISCHDLIQQLKRAHFENNLEERMKHFNKYHCLIIDEVGYLPIDQEGANLFFQLISKRYEHKSTIITTNKPLNRWTDIFQDPVTVNAILDRLLHHSHLINIIGQSYRIKDKLDQFED